jgi:hypothetical protein
MFRQGFNKATLKPGDEVQVSGVLAAAGQVIDGSLASRADLVTVNGTTVFDRSKLIATTGTEADKRQKKLERLLIMLSETEMHLQSIQSGQSGDGDNQSAVQNTKALIANLKAQVDTVKKEMAAAGK